MKYGLIVVGRSLPKAYDTIQQEYAKRLSRWCEIEQMLIPPARGESSQVIVRDSLAILSKVKARDFVVLLDERGLQFDSPSFAKQVENWNVRGKRVLFIIGGAYGVDESVRSRADVVWSLSPLVFPHELVRVMWHEQLYRAHSILANTPYHHS